MQARLPLEPEPHMAMTPPSLPAWPEQLAPAVPAAPPLLATRELVFTRHPRARRYVIRVDDNGVVRVTVPRWGSKREAREFAAQQGAWIARQLEKIRAERERRAAAGLDTAATPDPTLERALRARAHRELPARLLELASQHGLAVTRVSIRDQRWRWGSCNRTGHICLNWRLVTMPDSVRDYVLIHELMHLKRMDHSPRFWKLVAAACPDYRNARAYLRAFRH